MDGFEWEESKRQRDIEDHGIDFRLAALIFKGPVVEAEDERDDYGETRYRALGASATSTSSLLTHGAALTAASSAPGR